MLSTLTQKQKAEAFEKLVEKTKEYGSVSNACSVLIGFYQASNNYTLVSVFTELRSDSRG